MEITITLLTGTSQTLTVRPEDTVGTLKNLIEAKMGIPAHTQKLLMGGSQRTALENDHSTVDSYGLRAGSTVCLLVKESEIIQVFLRNERGQLSTYEIDESEGVSDFKLKVEKREGVPVSQQRLIHQGRELASGKLSDYNVKALSTIDMTFRLRGG
ncbi:ubiquitin-like protein ISG15 [Corythoichthys intestinalis]|uniref:ubiquitin-like protein ISG15 n=1 Tax=Corythoichthys intestinalis TaxID=161448 RepID=UPI0025A62243|nr:ubiquitin-like protein ISG15 [Corythoichthys intestinalis]XP_061804062.1 ubiquitin-like protein ISG15 [Nerophis lumbriciformis]